MLIPTQLVIDTCYATFVKLEGDKLGEAETKTTWEGRLAMVASNRSADEGEQEAFVVSKYDLLPESLADMVQVSCSSLEIARVCIGDTLFVGAPLVLNEHILRPEGFPSCAC